MRTAFAWIALAGCAGTTPPPAPAPAPAPTPPTAPADGSGSAPAAGSAAAPAGSAATAPTPPPAPVTGGSVIVGEITAPKAFDPNPVIAALRPQFESCYAQARATKPDLHGKLMLEVVVSQGGKVVNVMPAPSGGNASDLGLLGCMTDVLKGAMFPKPSGTATMVVPLVFRP